MKPADKVALNASPLDKKRFWARVVKTDLCWLAPQNDPRGYSRFYIGGHYASAHRCTKIWQSGVAPCDKLACHLCLNKNCVRPAHLYWGSNTENMADKIRDGTHRIAHLQGSRRKLAKLTEPQALLIYKELSAGGVSCKTMAERFGVSISVINSIGRQIAWRHVIGHLPPILLPRRERGMAVGGKHHRAKLCESQVKEIKELLKKNATCKDIAKQYGVSGGTIQNIANGKNWLHVK